MSAGTEDYNPSQVHQIVSDFEQALLVNPEIRLEAYLQGEGAFRWHLMVELIHTDLEMRLRKGDDIFLYNYIDKYPEVRTSPKDIDSLLKTEMQWRNHQGLPLDREKMELLYPDHIPLIRQQFIRLGKMPQIPGFLWLEELGSGSFGVVYKALQTSLNRPVAIKVLKRNTQELSSQEMIRFLGEAEVIASLRNPHVVEVYDFQARHQPPYLVLEYLAGGTLADRLKAGLMPLRDVARVVRNIAAGVHSIHSRGIIHRDLKPCNILFDETGRCKVTDFGLAKRESSELTAHYAQIGTAAYMSPEQAEGRSKFVSPQADVWALGVILYECLTGHLPFKEEDTLEVLQLVIKAEPIKPRELRSAIPARLEDICLRCLAKDPAARYSSAKALATDLNDFIQKERRGGT
jgi:hypothetical protein